VPTITTTVVGRRSRAAVAAESRGRAGRVASTIAQRAAVAPNSANAERTWTSRRKSYKSRVA
jgi:hypothetical protein